MIGSRRLSTELGDLAEAVNRDGKSRPPFDYSYDADGHPDNFYCRSDHYMYARYGIPITFFSTGGHRDYHQVTDEIQYLDFDKYARVTQFVARWPTGWPTSTTGRWWTSRSRIPRRRASSSR